MVAEVVFGASLSLLIYVFFGYPIAVLTFAKLRARSHRMASRADVVSRSISVIVPCRNEEDTIERKLRNLLELDYEGDLEILFIDDASTDRTLEIGTRLTSERVKMIANSRRMGKLHSLRQAATQARGDILLITDCAAELGPQTVGQLVRHFSDDRVGLVTGQYRAIPPHCDARSRGEGLYWRYEMALRRSESALGTTTHATGALFAVRADLFASIAWRDDATNDDIFVPVRILQMGYDVRCEPEAEAVEHVTIRVGAEFRRRARIASGNFQMARELPGLLRSGRFFAAFQLLSHKLLRNASGLFLLGLLISNIWLAGTHILWNVALAGQLAFLGLAVCGWLFRPTRGPGRFLAIPFYFLAGVLASLWGMVLWIRGSRTHIWDRSDVTVGEYYGPAN